MKILFIFLFVSLLASAQTDIQRWGKVDISYQIKPVTAERNSGNGSVSITDLMVSSLIHAYRIFISDVDGDNCAFNPTCSSFFVESIKETNIFQGTLMFADRLIRDTDFIGRESQYPLALNGRFYDLPSNYKLNPMEIKYIPPFAVVKDE